MKIQPTLKDWYNCLGWDSHGNVTTYTQPASNTKTGSKPGEYEIGGESHYP